MHGEHSEREQGTPAGAAVLGAHPAWSKTTISLRQKPDGSGHITGDKPCPLCGGTGKMFAPYTNTYMPCNNCNGTGRMVVHTNYPVKEKVCPTCEGGGTLGGPGINDMCDNCDGTGRVFVQTAAPVEDILDEARRITDSDRNKAYGDPEDNFARIAKAWETILGVEISPSKVALAMIMVKVIREAHAPSRDNWVDAAGYARCGWRAAGRP